MGESKASLWSRFKPWVLPTSSPVVRNARIAAGLYHYRLERGGQYVRFHLRVENSGQALLLVAAVEAVRLTQSGAIAAYGILEGWPESKILGDLESVGNGRQIILEVRNMIGELGSSSKRYPIFNLTDSSGGEAPLGLIAPFQADLVLGDWDATRLYLHALWNAGIPHVRFLVESDSTCGQQQIDVLCSAIQLAEDIGMIAGVRMTASHLLHVDTDRRKSVLDRIAEFGVDYVVVPWAISLESHQRLFGGDDYAAIRPLIQAADRWEVTTVLEAALTQQSAQVFESEMDTMHGLGVEYLEVFAVAQTPDSKTLNSNQNQMATAAFTAFEHQQLRQLAGWIEDLAEDRRIQIIWLPPVSKKGVLSDAMTADLIRRGPRAGADISLRVEADGRVFPPRGPRICVGIIHRTVWSEIWGHSSFLRYRKMVSKLDLCADCPMLTMCAAQCPADPQGWAIEE